MPQLAGIQTAKLAYLASIEVGSILHLSLLL